MTESKYEQGLCDIREWLSHGNVKEIDLKISFCQENYPDDPYYQPYYDAMLAELRKAKAESEKK